MASPRVSAPLWDADGVLIGGTRWKPVSSVRLQRYGFEFDALVRGEAHERADKRVSGGDAAPLLASLGASREALRHIWNLADTQRAGSLRFDEFVIACYLAERQAQGQQPPESLEAFPLGTFPPRAEGALAPLVKLPTPPPKARTTEVVPFDLTEPGSFNERASRRREEEATASAAAAAEKKVADPKRIEDLHAAAEKRAIALEAERARVERERLARETAECTFAPEKVSDDVDGDKAKTRTPLRDRASGIVVARDQKRWLAGELLKHEERDALKAEAEKNAVRVDLEVDPAEFAATTARRWEEEKRAREDALDAKREARAIEEATPSVPRFVAPSVAGLEHETWNRDEYWRERREGPWHERLSRTETPSQKKGERADEDEAAASLSANLSGPSMSPATRSAEALHAARALHVEAQLRERRREAEAVAATKEAAATASAPKMSSRSFEAHASRARKRLVAVMRLARVLLAGDLFATEERGAETLTSRTTAQTLPREAVARVLRATKMLPSTIPEAREAQRDEARKVYRLCEALRDDTDASDDATKNAVVSATLVARFVGAGVQAGLERAGASFDEKALRSRRDDESDADDPDAGIFGAAFDAGRLAHARRQPWWPASFDDERAEAVRDAFESLAGARAARETLSRTPLGKKTKSSPVAAIPGMTPVKPADAVALGVTPSSRKTKSRANVAERLAAKRAAADAAVEAARAARDALEAAECTFRPKLTPRPSSTRRLSTPSLGGGLGETDASERVFSPSRAARALRRSHETAEALAFSAVTGERRDKPPARTSREEKEARELAECTFAPRINRNSKLLARAAETKTKTKRATRGADAFAVSDADERRRARDDTAFFSETRKPWEPRGVNAARLAPPRRPAGAPRGFENTVRRMREANARAAAQKNLALGAVERRASWLDPREMRRRLADETETRRKLSPGFRERERARRAAALAEIKRSRQKTAAIRLSASRSSRRGERATPKSTTSRSYDARAKKAAPTTASLAPAKTNASDYPTPNAHFATGYPGSPGEEKQKATSSSSSFGLEPPETPFAFRVDDGLPPAPPRTSPRVSPPGNRVSEPASASPARAPRLPATPSSFGSRASSARSGGRAPSETGTRPPRLELPRTPRSPRSPVPLAEAPPWSSSVRSVGSRSPSLASTPGSARSRSARNSNSNANGSFVESPPPTSARATLRMNKNAPSLLFSPGSASASPSAGSPNGVFGSDGSDGYPYTKFVLGPPLARIELTIGEARGKTSFLTFHANETADGAARRFCDANRLPNSTVPDVRAVLEDALRRNEIEIEAANDALADDSFRDELSPLFREKTAPTLADLAA